VQARGKNTDPLVRQKIAALRALFLMPALPNQQTRAASRRDFRVVIMPVLVAAIGWACLTPFGGWVQSFFFGTGVRWSNAYVALETAEANLPRNERDRERLLMVTAMTEGEAPIGFKPGPRLHPVGTLAHLRYEIRRERCLDEHVEVRTLAHHRPRRPEWKPCGTSCREEIERSTGTVIRRSGEAGIAEEWCCACPSASRSTEAHVAADARHTDTRASHEPEFDKSRQQISAATREDPGHADQSLPG
jgi:hypothetical protein